MLLGRQITVVALVMLTSLAGCSGILSKPYPEKVRYALDVPMPKAQPAGPLPALRVSLVRAYPPYDSSSLVYRTGASTYASDYYKTFIASPDRLLTGQIVDYLSRTGQFSVVSTGITGEARYVLDADLVSLYGDYTKGLTPAAVVAIRFFLIDDENAAAKVLFQKTYRATEPLADKSAEALVQGWNKALGTILAELSADIGAVVATPNPTARAH
jgi:ABC-type uncharacterized transport system auxiliary subunit